MSDTESDLHICAPARAAELREKRKQLAFDCLDYVAEAGDEGYMTTRDMLNLLNEHFDDWLEDQGL